MPDRRLALKTVSSALLQQVAALEALTQPGDEILPESMRLLLDAIDRVDAGVRACGQGAAS